MTAGFDEIGSCSLTRWTAVEVTPARRSILRVGHVVIVTDGDGVADNEMRSDGGVT